MSIDSSVLPVDRADYVVLIADEDLNAVGDPILSWTSIDVTLRFNEPSSGIVTMPGYDWIRDQLHPGCRLMVVRNGEMLIIGPVEQWLWERSDDGDNAGAGTLTVHFADYLSLVVSRLTYPNPDLAPAAQVADNWTFTGTAEAALRDLVLRQAGPSALTARKIPKLALGALAGIGSSITSKADRMEPMGDVMRRIAVAGGGLGFRTDYVNGQIEFVVFTPPDLSNQVVFGFGAGSLKYLAYEVTAPAVNVAIVGGQGEGADRFVLERVNDGSVDAWDRRETLVSRPGNDPTADLNAAGDEALADGAETGRLATSTADTPYQRFSRDYTVGAKVSVETWPGSMVADVIVTVHLQVYPTSGEVISATVGSQAENSDPKWIQRMRAMDKRISYLERNVVPAAV